MGAAFGEHRLTFWRVAVCYDSVPEALHVAMLSWFVSVVMGGGVRRRLFGLAWSIGSTS